MYVPSYTMRTKLWENHKYTNQIYPTDSQLCQDVVLILRFHLTDHTAGEIDAIHVQEGLNQ